MNNVLKISAAVAFAAFATTASAECTEESMKAKAMEISNGLQALAATNPELLMEISTDLQTTMAASAGAENMDAICAFLDETTAKMAE